MLARPPGHEDDAVGILIDQPVVADAETQDAGIEILELVDVIAVDAEMAEHYRRRQ